MTLAFVAGILVCLLGAGMWIARKVRQAERLKRARATIRAHEARDEIEDAISGRADEENRKRLGKWSSKS